jgi:hypothetical protein
MSTLEKEKMTKSLFENMSDRYKLHLKTKISVVAFAVMLLSACGNSNVSSSSDTVRPTPPHLKKSDLDIATENYIRNEMVGDTPQEKDAQIVLLCSQTREQKELQSLFGAMGDFVDEFKALKFNSLSYDQQFDLWEKACAVILKERPELQAQSEKIFAKNDFESKKLQKELDDLNAKTSKQGGGTYSELLDAQWALEKLIAQGAQFSLTGQSREVEDVSCFATTYSRWENGIPSATWYCYFYFLDGNEPYTISVNGSKWGGKADRGSSAGKILEYKISDSLKKSLNLN